MTMCNECERLPEIKGLDVQRILEAAMIYGDAISFDGERTFHINPNGDPEDIADFRAFMDLSYECLGQQYRVI